MSPTPGRSTLIQSAPIYARSCVQVGPDCTCVKSRMRTPSSALPAWPNGFLDGGGSSDFDAAFLAAFLVLSAALPPPFDFFAFDVFFIDGFSLAFTFDF